MKTVRNVVSRVEFQLSNEEFDRLKADPVLGETIEEIKAESKKDKAPKE